MNIWKKTSLPMPPLSKKKKTTFTWKLVIFKKKVKVLLFAVLNAHTHQLRTVIISAIKSKHDTFFIYKNKQSSE